MKIRDIVEIIETYKLYKSRLDTGMPFDFEDIPAIEKATGEFLTKEKIDKIFENCKNFYKNWLDTEIK